MQFKTAKLLWYDTELKSAEEVKLQLQQDLQETISSSKFSANTDEYQKLEKGGESLKARLQDLTKELVTASGLAEELVKRNDYLNELFKLAPASKRKLLAPSLTQTPDPKRQKAAKASLVGDKPDVKSNVHLDPAARASAPVSGKADAEAKSTSTPATKWGDMETPPPA